MRERYLWEGKDFAFETLFSSVTSKHSKMDFLKRAKEQGAWITIIYALTRDKNINVQRVMQRVKEGGHFVPPEQITRLYDRCMLALPEVLHVVDDALLYDNTIENKPQLLLKKENNAITIFSENPKQDEFLQKTIVKPLQGYQYPIEYMPTHSKKLLNVEEPDF